MGHQNDIDAEKSDKTECDEEEIIELTEIVEVKPQTSLEKEISPDDFLDEQGVDLPDDGDTVESASEELPEPAVLSQPEEPPQESTGGDAPAVEQPMVDEIPDPDTDVSDLGALVSEITGAPSGTGEETPLPGLDDITSAQLDQAVEKAVEKLFKEKIEAKIMALFETVVKREIDKIAELIKEEAK